MKIPRAVWNKMIAHAKAGYPNEACGILGGRRPGEAEEFYPMRNLDESSISYFMDPKEQLHVFKDMRVKGMDLVGIFHSHVASAAYPSQKDVRLAFYPEASYLIVSLADLEKPVLKSFKIAEERVTEEALDLV